LRPPFATNCAAGQGIVVTLHPERRRRRQQHAASTQRPRAVNFGTGFLIREPAVTVAGLWTTAARVLRSVQSP
jgi:hypothetical protein